MESSTDVILSRGWTYNGTYSNMYRLPSGLVFKLAHLERRRSVALHISPMQAGTEQRSSFAVQTVTRYSQDGNAYVTVTTQVVPLSLSVETLLQNINYTAMAGLNHKISISNLRMVKSSVVSNTVLKTAAGVYQSLKRSYKSLEMFPPEAIVFLEGSLAFLKARHCNP